MTHAKFIFAAGAAFVLASAAATAKNYGALEIEPKGTAVSNGTKMSVVWRFVRQEEAVKIGSEKSGEKLYELSGAISTKKIGEMKIAQRVEKISDSRTRFEAETEIVGTPPRGSKLRPSFQFHLPADVFDGRIFADGKSVAPETKQFSASELSIQSENGELKISGKLDVEIKESVRQKVLKYRSISIMFDELGGGKYKTALDFSFDKNKKPVPLANEYSVRESRDYMPMPKPRKTKKNSALDFSFLLDAPAGKYGFVRAAGDSFVFEKRPARKARFFGANVCQTATIPSGESATALAEEFAASGYNTARLHQFSPILRGKKGDFAELNQKNMDKFDFLFAELKKRGIYITTDFYASGRLFPEEFDDVAYRGDNMKALFFVSDKARAALKRFIANFLNHVNPYTGLAYKDEPALVFASVVNEDCIENARNFVIRTHLDYDIAKPLYEKWLAGKPALPDGIDENEKFQIFLVERYESFYREMSAYIKSIAPNMLLTDQTNGGKLLATVMAERYDVYDTHLYNGHPLFYENRFTTPMYVDPADPLEKRGGAFMKIGATRLLTKPTAITEWDYVRPNPRAAVGGLLVGAYSALNGVDGLWQFCYTHHEKNICGNPPLGIFETAGDAARTLANKIGSLMFLRGDIAESGKTVALAVSDKPFDKCKNGDAYKFCDALAELALVAKSGVVAAADMPSLEKKLPKDTAAVLYTDAAFAPKDRKTFGASESAEKIANRVFLDDGGIKNGVYTSSTGELKLDSAKARWKAVAPRIEAFAQNGCSAQKGKFARVENTDGWSIVALCSLDGAELGKSKRILAAHISNIMNGGDRFGGRNFATLLGKGSGGYLLARAESKIEFAKRLDGFKCFALDATGKRIAEIPIERTENGAKLTLSTHNKFGATIAYELSAE